MDDQKTHNAIILWVKKGQPWKEGIDIFSKFSFKKKLLKRFIKSGPTEWNKGMLHFELTEHARYIEQSFRKSAPKATAFDPTSIDFALKPAEIQTIETRKYQAYMKAHELRFFHLPAAKTDAQRANITAEIVSLMKENQTYWDKLKAFEKNGTLPEKEKPIPPPQPDSEELTHLQMHKKLQYRRSNISTYKRFIADNPGHHTIPSKESKIVEWLAEIAFYEEKLNQAST